MTITSEKTDEFIKINVEGSIDVINAQVLQDAILKAFQESTVIHVDMEKATYICSSGLRAFLLGQKTAKSKGGAMKLFNVNETVMNVFSLTGFDNVLEIVK